MKKESGPILFIHNVVDWNLEDSKDKPLEGVRPISDEIEQRVKELFAVHKASQ